MFNSTINKAVNSWVNDGIIAEKDMDIYIYGLDLLVFSAINLIIIFVTAIITGRLIESIILLAVTIPLQVLGGGYHAKTHLNCFCIMYVGWWLIMWLAPNINFTMTVGILAMSAMLIFWLAPIPNVNAPISHIQSSKMKRYVRAFSIVFIIAALLSSDIFFGIQPINNFITIGIGTVAASMLAGKLRNYMDKIVHTK